MSIVRGRPRRRRRFVDDVAAIVDDIDVRAGLAGHPVAAAAAIQVVGAAAAGEPVEGGVAEELFGCCRADKLDRENAQRMQFRDRPGGDGEIGNGPDFLAVDDIDLDVRRARR